MKYPSLRYLDEVRALYSNPDKLRELSVDHARVVQCLPFVVKMARRWTGNGVSFEDLIQAGNVGVLTSLKTFDETRGAKFLTYAAHLIYREIKNCVADHGNTVRVPRNVYGHRAPQRLIDASEPARRPVRTSKGVLNGIPEDKPPPGDSLERWEEVELLRSKLDELPERQGNVIRRRLEGWTLEELGKELGVSKERVRQLEKNGLMQLAKLFGIRACDAPKSVAASIR